MADIPLATEESPKLVYDWFTEKVKKLSSFVWLPTDSNIIALSQFDSNNVLKSSTERAIELTTDRSFNTCIKSEHFLNNYDPDFQSTFKYNFKSSLFPENRLYKRYTLCKNFNFGLIVELEKINFLNNPGPFLKIINDFFDNNPPDEKLSYFDGEFIVSKKKLFVALKIAISRLITSMKTS